METEVISCGRFRGVADIPSANREKHVNVEFCADSKCWQPKNLGDEGVEKKGIQDW